MANMDRRLRSLGKLSPSQSHPQEEKEQPKAEPPKADKSYTISEEWREVLKNAVREILVELVSESDVLRRQPELLASIAKPRIDNEPRENEDGEERWSSFFTSQTYRSGEIGTVKSEKNLTVQCLLTQDAFDKAKDNLLMYPFGTERTNTLIPDTTVFSVTSFGSSAPGKNMIGTTVDEDGVKTIKFSASALRKLKLSLPVLFSAVLSQSD